MVPRIKADNIAEHIALQREAVLDAAVRLFTERGFTEVALGDIAAEVGLARNSVYRYVPDKTHLLVEWYRRTVPQIISSWQEADSGDDPPDQRLHRWAYTYLSWARTPEHSLVAPLTDALDQLDEATRAEVADLHRSMMAVVTAVVEEAGVKPSEVAGCVELISGIVLGAARAETNGADRGALRPRIDAAVAAVLSASGR